AAHGELQSLAADLQQLFAGLGDAAARAAEGVRRAHDAGVRDFIEDGAQIVIALYDPALRHRLADLVHQRAEEFAVLCLSDRFKLRAQPLDVVLLKDSELSELAGEVKSGL